MNSMNISQQAQNQQDVRELSTEEVKNYFNPPPMPMWTVFAIIVSILLLSSGIILHYILLFIAGPIVILLSIVELIVITVSIDVFRRWIQSNPDDESYDAWVRCQAIKLHARGLDTLAIQPHNQDRLLTIRSYVLPGSEDAQDIPSNEVLM